MVPKSKKELLGADPDENLASATLSVTVSADLADGGRKEPSTTTIPLRSNGNMNARISIFETYGSFVDHLTVGVRVDILGDARIPSIFVEKGTWTFEFVARSGDGTCLFAMTLTQWLDGHFGRWGGD
jgi:hypothetical protein